MTEVVLYGKAGCCLCDEAKVEIERARERRPFDLREVDVSLDPVLNRVYGERIPVVEVGGVETFEYRVDAETLIEALGTVAS